MILYVAQPANHLYPSLNYLLIDFQHARFILGIAVSHILVIVVINQDDCSIGFDSGGLGPLNGSLSFFLIAIELFKISLWLARATILK